MIHPDLSAAAWRKSSHSGANGSCVEVAPVPGALAGLIAVRDSKNRGGPALVFTARQWHAFATGIRDGSLDLS